jgi:hypothetical protein
MIHGRKYWRSCRHGRWCRCGSPRLHGSPMEEREAHNLVSPYRLDLLEQLILAHNQVEVVSFPVFSIKTHSPQTVGLTRRLAKSLAIRDPRIFSQFTASQTLPSPALSHSIFCSLTYALHSRHRSLQLLQRHGPCCAPEHLHVHMQSGYLQQNPSNHQRDRTQQLWWRNMGP